MAGCPFLSNTGFRGQVRSAGHELEEEAMNTKTGAIAAKVIGSVLAGFIAVGVAAAPSSIVASGSDSVVAASVIQRDTGW